MDHTLVAGTWQWYSKPIFRNNQYIYTAAGSANQSELMAVENALEKQ